MADSNTQGAPTEGLGQSVTFAFKPGSGIPVLNPTRVPDVQVGTRGGPATQLNALQPQQRDPYATETLDFLVNVGQAILKPKLEQAKMDRYVAGMQQAATGDAMADIAARQPWYSKIFGDSDTVEGARAYHSEAIANKAVLDMEADMPRLRSLDPGSVQTEYSKRLAGVLTGDKATDAAVMAGLTRAMPAFMRRQAKEHYSWRQERAAEAEGDAFRTHAATMQSLGVPYQSGIVSPEDYTESAQRFLLSQLPAAGRDPESWKKDMTARLIGAARDGQFHALGVLRTPPMKGAPSMFELLDDEQRVRVEAAVAAAESRAKAEAGSGYMDRWSEIMARSKALPVHGGLTADQTRDQIDALNNDWMRETGITTPLINASTGAGIVENALDAAIKNNEAEAKAAKAAAAAATTETGKAEAVLRGVNANVTSFRTHGKATDVSNKEDIRLAWAAIKSKATDEAGHGEYLNTVKQVYLNDPGSADEALKDQLQGAIRQARAGGNPDAIVAPYMLWKQLQQRAPDLATFYAGEFGADMNRLDLALSSTQQAGPGSPEVARAFQSVFMEPQVRGQGTMKPDDRKALLEGVAGWSQGKMNWFARVLAPDFQVTPGENVLRAADVGRLAETISGTVGEITAAGQSFDSSVRGALTAQQARGLEVFGGTFWRRGPNDVAFDKFMDDGDPTVFGAGSSVPRSEHHRVTERAITAKLAEANIDIDDWSLVRVADDRGEPQFLVFALDSNGNPFHTMITGNYIKSHWLGKKAEKEAAAAAVAAPTGVGVPRTLPTPGGVARPFQ